MATTESLIVELDAKVDGYNKKMKEAEDNTKKVGVSAKDMGNAVTAGVKIASAAVLTLGAALTAMVITSAKGRAELEGLTRQAKLSAGEFESLAFATRQFGINGEQIADISKDIGDKLGEFARDASGPFQDFANQLKLSKVEAQELAKEFGTLSSDQVIGRMISMMEAVNTPANQVTQVLESMGNDLSRLTPLFINNSKALNELRARFDEINSSLNITKVQANELRDTATTFDLLTSSIGKASTSISATLAPVFNDFFNDVIKVVPDATQVVVDFINSFLDAEDIKTISALDKQIEKANDTMKSLAVSSQLVKEAFASGDFRGISDATISKANEFNEAEQRLVKLLEQKVEITKQQRLLDADRPEGGAITGEGGTFGTGAGGGQLSAIEDRFKTETQLLIEKHGEEKAILDLEVEDLERRNELKFLLTQELFGKLDDLDEKEFQTKKKRDDQLIKESQKAEFRKFKNQEKIINAGMALNNALFEDNKAINAGLIVADTASAIMASLKINPYDYLNVGVLAATGIAQLANATGASKGGGGVSSSSGGGGQQQQNFERDTSLLDLTEATESGVNTFRIAFDTDSGNDIIDAIAEGLNNGQRRGQF